MFIGRLRKLSRASGMRNFLEAAIRRGKESLRNPGSFFASPQVRRRKRILLYSGVAMKLLISVYLSLFGAQYLSDLPITPLSFDAREFKQSFNSAADRTRLVVVFSPT